MIVLEAGLNFESLNGGIWQFLQKDDRIWMLHCHESSSAIQFSEVEAYRAEATTQVILALRLDGIHHSTLWLSLSEYRQKLERIFGEPKEPLVERNH